MSPAAETPAPIDFEDALRRLEGVVDDLEAGEPDLSAALAKYEQGVRLLTECQGVLDRAERTVALLTGVDPEGRPQTAPFDAAATADRPEPPISPKSPKARKQPPGEANDRLIPF